MKTVDHQESVSTVTGMFATGKDAEKAYQTLLDLGYHKEEITLVMSEAAYKELIQAHTQQNVHPTFVISRPGRSAGFREALDQYAHYVGIPGLSFMVVGNLTEGGLRTISDTILSDEYAEYFQRSVRSGEILIDFGLHNAREKNLITDLWENFGGHPLVRPVGNAA
ncbi:hypothetical protein [Dyadobacter sandarakinus]|uniref:Uncharacterized protein n=1 Tax=Dyadobacter sandarakinus TaxID=2747268 RepID=A0ABX7I4W5_9BACT|nr:hypothetical protein [Dyadobacter sandarakinus]QRR00915.1 hypothetical protein HWI92_08370 [Dyadobacter sandarakinus]